MARYLLDSRCCVLCTATYIALILTTVSLLPLLTRGFLLRALLLHPSIPAARPYRFPATITFPFFLSSPSGTISICCKTLSAAAPPMGASLCSVLAPPTRATYSLGLFWLQPGPHQQPSSSPLPQGLRLLQSTSLGFDYHLYLLPPLWCFMGLSLPRHAPPPAHAVPPLQPSSPLAVPGPLQQPSSSPLLQGLRLLQSTSLGFDHHLYLLPPLWCFMGLSLLRHAPPPAHAVPPLQPPFPLAVPGQCRLPVSSSRVHRFSSAWPPPATPAPCPLVRIRAPSSRAPYAVVLSRFRPGQRPFAAEPPLARPHALLAPEVPSPKVLAAALS